MEINGEKSVRSTLLFSGKSGCKLDYIDFTHLHSSSQATSTRIRFHSVFILFQVMGPLFSRTENNIKTLGKRIRVNVASQSFLGYLDL